MGQLAAAERLNRLDLGQLWKARVAHCATSNFWALFKSTKRTLFSPSHIKASIGDLYTQVPYPEQNSHENAAQLVQKTTDAISSLDDDFSPSELRRALLSVGRGKAPGLDGIPNIALRVATDSPKFLASLLSYYNLLLGNRTQNNSFEDSASPTSTSLLGYTGLTSILHPIPKHDGGVMF